MGLFLSLGKVVLAAWVHHVVVLCLQSLVLGHRIDTHHQYQDLEMGLVALMEGTAAAVEYQEDEDHHRPFPMDWDSYP